MSALRRRRAAALLEVLGVYVVGAALNDRVIDLLNHFHLISTVSPFDLLTEHTTNADLVLASRQMLLALVLLYGCYFLLIVPMNWWHRRRGRAAYGLTRAGHRLQWLIWAGFATSVLSQWPVLIHTLVDAIHPLGATVPWRQALFDMSWRRWQFWLFTGVASYALIPIVEELIFRGYYQCRLAEDWGDGPAILATACFFTFAHRQYLIANAYNITMVISLFCMAIGLGVVFAWTRSLIPSMIAHAIINVPMTAPWQGALLVVFVIGIFFFWRGGLQAIKAAFTNAKMTACVLLAAIETFYVLEHDRISSMTEIALGMLIIALVLEALDRRQSQRSPADSALARTS